MTDRSKELFDSTWDCFHDLRMVSLDLSSLARQVDYLHPKLAHELGQLSDEVKRLQETLRNNYGEKQNLDTQASEASTGAMLGLLIHQMAKEIPE